MRYLLLSLFCLPVGAGTILFSNLGANNSFNTSQAWILGNGTGFGNAGVEDAFAFVPSQSAVLTTISVPLSLVQGTNGVLLNVYANTNGAPGTLLASATATPTLTNTLTLVAISINGPLLSQGTTYWLGIIPTDPLNTRIHWALNNTNDTGTRAVRTAGTTTWNTNQTGITNAAFQLTNDTTIPEPSTIGLIGIGLLACYVRVRRKS